MPEMANNSLGRYHRNRIGVGGLLTAVLTGICLVPALAQQTSDESLRQEMQQGAAMMTNGSFSAAVTAYRGVVQSSPQFAEGYLNLGLALYQTGQTEEARAALEKALRLKPGLHGANLFLGIIAYHQNHFKAAENHLLRETHLDPHSAKAFMWLGVCRLAQDDPHGAIAPLDEAYALAPTDADILYHRGRAYFLVANSSYAAMFNLDHDSTRVHQVLAEAYAQAYRRDEAIKEFEVAIIMAPNQPGLHEELGDQYWANGQLDKAEGMYRSELHIDSNAATAMYKLGSLLILSRNASEGVQLLRNALQEDPSLKDAHYYLGNGLTALNQNQEAIHEFQLAIAADPQAPRAMTSYYKLSQLYRKLNETDQAQLALKNFLQMRAESQEKRDRGAAQRIRKRNELPVDPEQNMTSP